MRFRITLAMVLMVLGTLVGSGVVSLLLAARSTIDQSRQEIVREAQSFALSVPSEAQGRLHPAKALRTIVMALKGPLHVDDSGLLVVLPRRHGPILYEPYSRTPLRPALPAGLTASDLNPSALMDLQTVSGHKGAIVYAAAPYRAPLRFASRSREVVQAVLLARRPPSALATAGPWFGLSSLVILLLAAVVAYRLGRRFVRPIHDTQEVTARIAGGDLQARVPEPPGADVELAALARSVNSMADGLARARRSEQQFLQSVSHDLRTPLTSIRGFAEAIEDGATDDVVAAAGVIASEGRRLQRLVADLLALATVEARRFALQIQPMDLAGAVERAAAGFAREANELGLSLSVDALLPVGVLADPDRLGQVAANLIENALRFATYEVRVGASAGLVAGEGRLFVEDDGPGIAREDLDRVFERLYASRASAGRSIGTGLGLSIVAELAAAMGGRAWAESPIRADGG
ncbi:MAG: HAMP domain-containing histidine kinase, partial [Acidimicrobiaceae bacterium]|nr:HAMP domain-containing histidine kinase [Acidimicrobiaceae bacterium]